MWKEGKKGEIKTEKKVASKQQVKLRANATNEECILI